MATLMEATQTLMAAAATVTGVSVHRGDRTGTMRTPAVVVSLPTVTWSAYCPDPTEAEFRVSLVVALDEYAMDRLMELLPLLHEALEGTGATVTQALAVPFDSPLGSAGLASYELVTTFPL